MTTIEWTDVTWNPVTGCTHVSEGCRNCYAALQTKRLVALNRDRPALAAKYDGLVGHNGRFNGTVYCHQDRLKVPLHIRKPSMIFVNSMSDLFHEKVPREFIDQVWAVMALCPHLIFQVLTKRPERMAEYLNTEDTPHRIAKAMDAIQVQQEIADLSERWRVIPGFPKYEVSNHGRVRGPRGEQRPQPGDQGHCRVTLRNAKGPERVLLHRLVLRVFDREPRDGEQVRHRNGEPTCNAIPNLRWGSQSDNWQDRKRHGTHRAYSKLTHEQVGRIKVRMKSGAVAEHLATEYGVSATQIRNIARGKQWCTESGIDWPLSGVWLGTSCEDQPSFDERWEHLRRCPAAVRFISFEPLLGPIDTSPVLGDGQCVDCQWRGFNEEITGYGHDWVPEDDDQEAGLVCPACQTQTVTTMPPSAFAPEIQWAIVGGESGPKCRPMEDAWAIDIVKQCRAAGVPVFVKQRGGFPKARKDPAEWPEELQVREWPRSIAAR